MARKVLFVCTGNLDRSPTAEWLLKRKGGFDVKSAGTWVYARTKLSGGLIDWADVIFAMEDEHKEAILAIRPEAEDKLVVLNIPNLYKRDDPELISLLEEKLSRCLEEK